jgi:hypothetical protein
MSWSANRNRRSDMITHLHYVCSKRLHSQTIVGVFLLLAGGFQLSAQTAPLNGPKASR